MNKWISAAIIFCMVSLFGCGGGGGGSSSGGGGGGTTVTTTIAGVASKGPISNATVSVAAVTGGAKGALLGTTTTNSLGAYSLSVGSYTGPVWIEVTGGFYDDEASLALTPLNIPLRAFLPNASGAVNASVTPLTELAARKALSGALSASAITAANQAVSDLFTVDIINTVPVDATFFSTNPSAAAETYGLALATLSQYMKDQEKPLSDVLSDMAVNSIGSLTSTSAALFRSELSRYMNSRYNRTSFTSAGQTPLSTIGTVTTAAKTTLRITKNTAWTTVSSTNTLEATFYPPVPDNTRITFSITSANASFVGGGTTKTVSVSNNTAVVDIVSSIDGGVTVTATSPAATTATVTFYPPPPPEVPIELLVLDVSKTSALANGADKITLTATCGSRIPDPIVTFTVFSGTALFADGKTTTTVKASNYKASVDLTSFTAGTVVVDARFTGAAARKSVSFLKASGAPVK